MSDLDQNSFDEPLSKDSLEEGYQALVNRQKRGAKINAYEETRNNIADVKAIFRGLLFFVGFSLAIGLWVDSAPWSIASYKTYRINTRAAVLIKLDSNQYNLFMDCVNQKVKVQGIVGTPPPANASIMQKVQGMTYLEKDLPQVTVISRECKQESAQENVIQRMDLNQQMKNRSTVSVFISFLVHLIKG